MSKKRAETLEKDAAADAAVNALCHIRDDRDKWRKRAGEQRQRIASLEAQLRHQEKLVAEYEKAREIKDFEINCYDVEDLFRWQATVEFRQNLDGKRKVSVQRHRGRQAPVSAPDMRDALELARARFGDARRRVASKR